MHAPILALHCFSVIGVPCSCNSFPKGHTLNCASSVLQSVLRGVGWWDSGTDACGWQ